MSLDKYTKKATGRDYGKKTYLTSDSFADYESVPSSKNMQDQKDFPDSEFKKPYFADSYSDMEYTADIPKGWSPDLNWSWSRPDSPGSYPEGEFAKPTSGVGGGGAYPKYKDRTDENKGTKDNPYDIFKDILPNSDRERAIPPDPTQNCICPGRSIAIMFPFKISGASGGDGVEHLYFTNSRTVKFDVSDNHRLGEGVTVSWQDMKTYETVYGNIKGCKPGECSSCSTESIGYTTNQMSTSGTQTLSVVNPQSGAPYKWAIKFGGGSLSASAGLSTVYTAPASNFGCFDNPTISLSLNGTECATLNIAINGDSGTNVAYTVRWNWQDPVPIPPHCHQVAYNAEYKCSGVKIGDATLKTCTDWCCFGDECCGNGSAPCNTHDCDPVGTVSDVRTSTQKAAGCCPAQLL